MPVVRIGEDRAGDERFRRGVVEQILQLRRRRRANVRPLRRAGAVSFGVLARD